MSEDLPPGFALDQQDSGPELPPGFTVDNASAPTEKQSYIGAREPDFSERLADWTGMSPDYWRGVLYRIQAPARVIEGMKRPFEGVTQAMPYAAEWLSSAGGYYPNAVSQFSRETAKGVDIRQSGPMRDMAKNQIMLELPAQPCRL